jgi:putative ABC transport system substrate-binding protein
MSARTNRRDFISLLSGAAAAGWPFAARTQTRPMHVIGLLNGQTSAASVNNLAALRQGLAETEFIEGRNLAIVYRAAEGNIARLPALATELVSLQVAVIAAVGGDNTVRSAKAATAIIPIVFTTASDPVETGIVASLNRPGGNVTGATGLGSLLAAKQIGLMRDMVSKLATVGLLTGPLVPMTAAIVRDVRGATQAVGLNAVVAEINSEGDLDATLKDFVAHQVDAILIPAGVFFARLRPRVLALTARYGIPTIAGSRDYPAQGGLMSYGAASGDTYRQAGLYVGRILKGDKPADLPVMQPTKFEFVINLNTARALRLTVPPTLLATADEVIE